MTRVLRELIEHELYLDPEAKPVKQRLCHFAQDKKDVIKKLYQPIPFLYLKRIKIGGCVLIIHILIRHVKKIPSACPELIRLWTLQPAAAF
jgi:hypothetical protein